MTVRLSALLIGVCLVLGIAAGVVAVWKFQDGPESHSAQSADWEPRTSSLEEASEVVAALEDLPSDPGALLSEATRTELRSDPGDAFPEGTTVDVDEMSWAPDGIGGGAIEITVIRPGVGAVRYLAVAAKEDGQWRVLTTLPVE